MSLSNLRTNEIPRTVEGEWLTLKNSVTKKRKEKKNGHLSPKLPSTITHSSSFF